MVFSHHNQGIVASEFHNWHSIPRAAHDHLLGKLNTCSRGYPTGIPRAYNKALTVRNGLEEPATAKSGIRSQSCSLFHLAHSRPHAESASRAIGRQVEQCANVSSLVSQDKGLFGAVGGLYHGKGTASAVPV